MKDNLKTKLFILILVAFLALLVAPFIGQFGSVTFSDILNSKSQGYQILYGLRLPRVLLGFFAGAALSLSGLIFQALFRNSLASPYTLGTSSGASFGAILFLKFGSFLPAFFLLQKETLGALFGAALSTAAVYLIFKTSRNKSPSTMLLSGVAISFFFSSLMLFLQYFSSYNESFEILRWLMGGLSVINYNSLYLLAPSAVIVFLYTLSKSKELDVLSLGDEFSQTKGLNTEQLRLRLYILVAILIALTVSQTGPIGFIGIIVPHALRLLVGPAHRLLIPLSTLLGGSFLVLCDTLARNILFPAELPVGIITAMLGGPFFLFLLLRDEKGSLLE